MQNIFRKTAVAATALAALGLGAHQAQAQTVVISQVAGGGGSSSPTASFKSDFIELYNNGLTTIDLTGYSVQYASATGIAVSTISTLTGTVASHDYFLIQTGTPGTGGSDLPTGPNGFAYNGTATLNLSGTSGKLFLVNNSTAATFTVVSTTPTFVPATFSTNVIDEVGYGTSNAYEGASPAPTESINLSDSRTLTAGIYTDTNNNGADFTSTVPSPHVGAYKPAAAPEPSSVVSMLVGMGVLGMIVARRRTRQSA